MKRIFCLIEDLGNGGAERQMIGLSKFLNKCDYNVKVVTYHNDPFYKYLLDEDNIDNECLSLAHNKFLRIFVIWRELIIYKPDVVISYLDTPSETACIIKHFYRKFKLIVSERNTTQIFSFKEKVKFFLYKNADFIVPNSFSQESFIKKNYPMFLSRIVTITNFVDTDVFTPRFDKVWFNVNKICNILCVGRIEEQKNVIRFIESIKIVVDRGASIHVRWVGTKSRYYQKCKELCQKLNIDKIFEFVGPCKKIQDEYGNSDVFCLPSIYEGFPNVLCEAMSSGLPILCSNICDNSKIVRNGVNGLLFDPLDKQDIASKVLEYLELSPAVKKSMAENSRRFAVKDFSRNIFIKKYISLIEAK